MPNYALNSYPNYPLDSINITESNSLKTPKAQKPLQVSEITRQIKSAIESDFPYVEVIGEISGFTLQKTNGHIYFSLKDENSMLSCTFFNFRNKKCPISRELKNGDKIIAKGEIKLYEQRGTFVSL
ncbi:exodeoxyribonuclease VII large subunit [Helicobacter saguini]|uniref:Exodeoxyribonuclease VII large subunit n=1 Tax=Helicobacter saguini TaxID=1548018 RepID=A0A347VP60_9HELI|nr:exodeoxyribonuclease VII large subunit [Helicobacter saguini]MWV61500.1 exodeoxyribonuclease VII large subunit [Helicobacter saguini]MWV67829.1 exodeoxyribonuclease VII large subunit [Helicobacter saguini]MWV70703.1 exodeoxyribonuclease VII large subunit [Helicobacter saguini]MWV72607.1 exodeoxyribonuclease VII large subunit [Helicobacter saguini]TLD94584.1 exodeoxyribonuclease VII large subunit [Helicobacter saguini]